MDIFFDYTALRLIWGTLLGVLFWAFALMDGFDLGVGILLPFTPKTDTEKRIFLNAVGPVWEGNQVWLILAAGAVFAAWPYVYAVLFSGLYLPLFGILCSLILRPVGFKFRSKLTHHTWRYFWDMCIFTAGVIPAFSFGLVLAHLLIGLPFHFDSELRLIFNENPHSLFHPFALCSGILWVVLFSLQGRIYLLHKTDGALREKIKKGITPSLFTSVMVFLILFALWHTLIPEYNVIQSTDLPSNPLTKKILLAENIPSHTFLDWLPLSGKSLILFTLITFFSALTHFLIKKERSGWGFITHSALLGFIIVFMGLSHFPLIVVSSTHLSHSLTLWDASSSLRTLQIMLIVTLIFIPLIIFYTAWVYRVMKGPIQEKSIQDNSGELY